MRASLLAGGLSWLWPVRPRAQEPPGLMDFAAGALARLITTTRERAIAAGVRPVPPGMQRALLGFFPASLLQRVRYRVVGPADGLFLPQLAFDHAHADAMTLGDVVLFRHEHMAMADPVLWAHELTHVMQYQRWGTDGFAARYVRDATGVEREARENAERFRGWQAGR